MQAPREEPGSQDRGKVVGGGKEKARVSNASPIAADGMLLVSSWNVAGAGEQLNILARNELEAPVFASPAILGGVVYLRTDKHLYAFKQ